MNRVVENSKNSVVNTSQDLNRGIKSQNLKKKKKKVLLIAMNVPVWNFKFPGDINLEEAIHTLKGRTAIQTNLEKLQK